MRKKASEYERLNRVAIILLRELCAPTDERLTPGEKALLSRVCDLVEDLDARVKTLTDTCVVAVSVLQGAEMSPDNKVVAINRVLESAFSPERVQN